MIAERSERNELTTRHGDHHDDNGNTQHVFDAKEQHWTHTHARAHARCCTCSVCT